MYRCPRCHAELPADARFCKNCGFNATNARLAVAQPPMQGAQQQTPLSSQQGPQGRTIQPQHKYVPQQAGTYNQTTSQVPPNVPLQNFPGALPNTPQSAAGRMSVPQNEQQVALSPQQQNGMQRNNGFQQPVQQPIQNVQLPTTPRQAPSNWIQQSPVAPQGQLLRAPSQWSEQVIRSSTPPTRQYTPPRPNFEPLQWGLGAPSEVSGSAESLAATSKAAQHWRQSWLDRQHDEAGPAVGVSRGQAAVPEPLLVMQNSLARMRAIILPKNGTGKNSRLRYWLPVLLLVCLIGGLGIYILSTYTDALLGTSPVSANTNAEPTLTMKNANTSVAAGQAIRVHGEHFGSNSAIFFYINGTQLKGADGKSVRAQSNDKGTFDTSVSIPTTQLAGEYVVEARTSTTGQHAFLTLQTTAGTTTDILKLSTPSLTFAAIAGRANPKSQSVTIQNTSNAAVQWSASAMSDNQAGWLVLTNGKTSGQLDAGGTDKISVSVATQGLTSDPKHPYTGEVVFTIVDQGQVMLPVKFTLSDTGAQFIISPNPLVGIQTTPGGCLPDTSITLINLSNAPIDWDAQTDAASQGSITLDGQQEDKGQLATFYPNDTKVIKIGCIGVQPDKHYAINVFYNGSQQLVPISFAKG